ncbi:type II toxin-antitoxin system Phd/YefM family antitoxin [Spiribacter sp. C176]|uniref:Type II toxin-antitoxin system Phd/YefM family antitoxin n=1 Tax=Spiribacter salilacus TaxID=2664894 RepID=A0A6N7QXE9_9GAMM|nr:type II toxin-antitoxin system Phd/YefM family antitoxin [Spiribacter salilacus]MRH79007.1 type II toxin-antitoxin system Phd/YefM family antitoxin [Spiribacter salilacus]
MSTITPSWLRANLYKVLDQVIETGEVVEISRRGRVIRLSAEPIRDLRVLEPHPEYLVGDPDEIAEIDWSDEWQP